MRQEKQLLLDEVKEKIEGSSAFILASHKKLNPNLGFGFRKALRSVGGSFCVVKKRLFLKATTALGLKIDAQTLGGHLAVISSGEDVAQTAKAVYTFSSECKENLEVLGGYFEGKLRSPEEIEEIAKLPSKIEMQAAFLGTLEAPLAQTLGTIEALLTSVLHCLDGKIKKEEGEPA